MNAKLNSSMRRDIAAHVAFGPVAGGDESGTGGHEGREAAEAAVEVPIST